MEARGVELGRDVDDRQTLLGWAMPFGADRRLVACAGYAAQLAGSLVLILHRLSELGSTQYDH
jgi:hypothetical protein